jgi:hypothetical protein
MILVSAKLKQELMHDKFFIHTLPSEVAKKIGISIKYTWTQITKKQSQKSVTKQKFPPLN